MTTLNRIGVLLLSSILRERVPQSAWLLLAVAQMQSWQFRHYECDNPEYARLGP